MPRVLKNPLARKRWNRFRSRRRAWVSMWLLLGLFIFSLAAEWIANDRPLLLRYEGNWYTPAFRFYPEDIFTGSGRFSRVDYKQLRNDPRFTDQPGNFMVFAPFPFGPQEIINPETLRDEERVVLRLSPLPRVGTVNVDGDGVIQRHQAADQFFVELGDIRGVDINDHWEVPPGMMEGIRVRLANQDAPALTVEVRSKRDSDVRVEWSLTRYTERARAPQDIRVTLREVVEERREALTFTFDREIRLHNRDDVPWLRIPDLQRNRLAAWVEERFEGAVYPSDIEFHGRLWTVNLRYNDVQWPFPPSRRHWMGIDAAGRDVFARILYGMRIALLFGLSLMLSTLVAGIIIGGIQGYYGGKIDIIGQRVIEIWSALPFLYVMILLGSVYGRSFGLLLFCYALFNWIGISAYMRAEFLKLRRRPFVEAARCLGLPAHTIMRRHILPNALIPLITFLPFMLVGSIGALTVLDFLGFGLPPPTPSWGELLHQAQAFRWAWWLILYPSAALFVVMILVTLIGEGIRDAYDPKPFSRME